MNFHADRLSELQRQNELDLARLLPDGLQTYPLDRYLGFFDALPRIGPYHHVPSEARDFGSRIGESGGTEALEAYNRLAMLRLIDRRLTSKTDDPLTDEIRELRDQHLARILDDMASPRKGFYRHGNDMFAKDFSVCRGKLLPCGVELVDVFSGVGRRVLIEGGFRQFVAGAAFFLRAMGAFRPMYELHFDRRQIAEFNADGYTALYLRLADLLALNPHIRGVVSSSWWHDPRLAEISPELDFIERHPIGAGARLLRGRETAAATADATRFAPHRAALYKAGDYRPRVYLLAWARRDILAWAERYRVGERSGERRERPIPRPSSAIR